jgi:hypothetical protein
LDLKTSTRWIVFGPIITLTGLGVFAIAVFLPFYEIVGPQREQMTLTFLRVLVGGGGLPAGMGAWLFTVAGVVILGGAAIAVLQGRPGWTRVLAATSAVWGLTWLGLLVSMPAGVHREVGYWGLVLGAILGFAGGILARLSAREQRKEIASPLA